MLVIQILNAVLDAAQKVVSPRHCVGGFLRHQTGAGHALQRIDRGPGAQFGKLPAAHHLQHLHGEFNLADAATRHLHIVGALGVACAALDGVFADLPVQHAQRVEHVVVQVAAEHKGQHRAAQRLRRAAGDAVLRCDHAAFEPGKTLPLAALHLKIFFQRAEGNRRRAGAAIGPQRQIDAKDKAVFGGVANQAVHRLDLTRKVFVVGDFSAPVAGAPGGFAVVVIDVDQVDVAGDVQLACTELAHADHPHAGALAACALGRAVLGVQRVAGVAHGRVEGQLGQLGHGAGDDGQRRLAVARAVAVEDNQALQHQLAQHAQRRAGFQRAGQ